MMNNISVVLELLAAYGAAVLLLVTVVALSTQFYLERRERTNNYKQLRRAKPLPNLSATTLRELGHNLNRTPQKGCGTGTACLRSNHCADTTCPGRPERCVKGGAACPKKPPF
jgi:hypothetical protein